jgi:hypothetical protein
VYFTFVSYSADKGVLIFMVAASSVCIPAEADAILSLKSVFVPNNW